MEKEVVKSPVQRPKKELQAILLTPPKVEKHEGQTTKKANVRGTVVHSWFMPSLWGSVHVAVRVHKNHIYIVNYLQCKVKLLVQSRSIYDDLTRTFSMILELVKEIIKMLKEL